MKIMKSPRKQTESQRWKYGRKSHNLNNPLRNPKSDKQGKNNKRKKIAKIIFDYWGLGIIKELLSCR